MSVVRGFILGVVLTGLWVLTPFRVLALAGETLRVPPTETRYDPQNDRYWDTLQLQATLESRGWSVAYADAIVVYGQPAWGVTDHQNHAIRIDNHLSWNGRYAVLAHEAGHTMEPSWLQGVENDCFAETVAALVVRDGLRNHARYLARARWTCVGTMLAVFPEMYRAAATFQD